MRGSKQLTGNHTPDASLLVIKRGTVSRLFLLASLVLASTHQVALRCSAHRRKKALVDPAAAVPVRRKEKKFAWPGLFLVLPSFLWLCRSNKACGATAAILCSLLVRIFPSHGGPSCTTQESDHTRFHIKVNLQGVIIQLEKDSLVRILSFTIPWVVEIFKKTKQT